MIGEKMIRTTNSTISKNLVEYVPTLEDNKIYPLFKKYCN